MIIDKSKKKRIIAIMFCVYSIFLLFLPSSGFAGSALSQTDDLNDICKHHRKDDATDPECNLSVHYLDIRKISREPLGDEGVVYLTMVTGGQIIEDDTIHYIIWYNNSASKYMMDYSNGTNYGGARNLEDENLTEEIKAPMVTNHTITVTYPLLNDSFPLEHIKGKAIETTSEYLYIDRVPNKNTEPNIYEANFTGSSDDQNNTYTDNATPGFSLVMISIAVVISYLIILRSKKYV